MCSSLAKCLLIVINLLFLLIAAALIAIGAILAFVPGVVLQDAYKSAKASAAAGGYSFPESADDLKDIPLAYNVGLALFIFGICLFILSMLGWCGSCCTSCCRWMLIVFAIVMLVLMAAEIVVVTMFYVPESPLHTTIRVELKKKIETEYKEDGKDSFSVAMNLVNKYFECCGIDSGKDFGSKSHRSCATKNEDTGEWNIKYHHWPNHPEHLECCRRWYAQHSVLSALTGCYTKLTDLVQANIIWAGLIFAGILLFQLIEIILAIYIFKSANKIGPI